MIVIAIWKEWNSARVVEIENLLKAERGLNVFITGLLKADDGKTQRQDIQREGTTIQQGPRQFNLRRVRLRWSRSRRGIATETDRQRQRQSHQRRGGRRRSRGVRCACGVFCGEVSPFAFAFAVTILCLFPVSSLPISLPCSLLFVLFFGNNILLVHRVSFLFAGVSLLASVSLLGLTPCVFACVVAWTVASWAVCRVALNLVVGHILGGAVPSMQFGFRHAQLRKLCGAQMYKSTIT